MAFGRQKASIISSSFSSFVLVALFFVVVVVDASKYGLNEKDRLVEYANRNYTWPIETFKPNNPGWKKLYEHRFRQLGEMEDKEHRWEGWLQSVYASSVVPAFTKYGFGIARAPENLMQALRQGIHDGLQDEANLRTEGDVDVIDGLEPWFIDRPDLTERVLKELQHYPETWAGMELTPFIAYGFRLYRNQSSLHMHIDRPQTHIISFILHIDSSEDADPWPILIEDYHGNTHEVVLKSGDLLFYESSKCFHGRPQKFNGSWYSSVFVHYYPTHGWKDTDHDLERHYAVPAHWRDPPQLPKLETPIQMVGTSMTEPTCPNNWCLSQNTIKWTGPGEDGYWIAPTGEKFPFVPHKIETCMDNEPNCTDWITWPTDECKRNPVYMLTHCKKSCGVCDNNNGGVHDAAKEEL